MSLGHGHAATPRGAAGGTGSRLRSGGAGHAAGASGQGDSVACIYRTTQAVDLYPLRLTEAATYTREDGRSVIRLRLALQAQAKIALLEVPRLRLFLHADRPLALALYAALTAKPVAMHVRVPGHPADRPGTPLPMPGLSLRPAGFAADERLWPKPRQRVRRLPADARILHVPEKFMFVDLFGLDLPAIAQLAPETEQFDVEVVLARPFPDDLRFSAENVRLHCAPIINLFELEADPVTVTHCETEYRVRAMAQHGRHVEAYSVDTVRGFEPASGERFEYAPFAAFRHRGGMLRHEMPERYFHTRVRRGPSGRMDTWLVLGGHAWEAQGHAARGNAVPVRHRYPRHAAAQGPA